MKVAIRSYSPNDNSLSSFGGGEHRWAVNLGWFLQREGHEVRFVEVGRDDGGFDVLLDGDARCDLYKTRKHVHHQFGPGDNQIVQYDCHGKERLNISVPYRETFDNNFNWAQERNINLLFLPMAYPDALLPENIRPGFERREITWANKDPFHPSFMTGENPIPRCAVDALRALVRLNKEVDFTFNLILHRHTTIGPGVTRLLKQLKDVKYYDVVPWHHLVEIMARSKMSISIAGLSGSFLESTFCKGLPIQNQGCFFAPDKNLNILPSPEETTEEDYYNAFETFWTDRSRYEALNEYYQNIFLDHRTEGLRKHWKESMEKLGL